jgi:hypothetical protein
MFKLMNATDENLLTESAFNSINKKLSSNSIVTAPHPNMAKPLVIRDKSARNLPSTTNLHK